jgi:ubiquinone/menaquinone biosynthesis C-methylase UbiE
MKKSTRSNWERFWKSKNQVEEVYSNSDRVLRNVIGLIDLQGKKVLEIGAGTGRDSLNMVNYGAEIYLLDYAEHSLRIIKAVVNGKLNVHILGGDAFSLPFPDGTFDIVFHQGLLEHFRKPDAERMLKENTRVVKKGGLLLVDVPQRWHIYTVIKHFLIALNAWFAGWERSFSVGELRREMKKQGLTIVHSYGEWMYPSLFYRMMREGLRKVGIKLPLSPQPIKPLSRLRASIRARLWKRKIIQHTGLSIGVVGKKT